MRDPLWHFIRTRRYARLALGLILCCSSLICIDGFAQSARTPASGSAEREAIMDALRVPAKKDLGRDVIFKVERLRVAGDWAFARVSPTLPDGSEIDYAKTKFRKQIELGAFDPQGEALLQRDADGWKVLEWVFGRTDVASVTWSERYRFPKSLLE
ncbi:MAG: hypothetical protein M3Z64_12310 [Verrucomicrobiota bacterium]|nr:hypothetical protein [Verrucomicrobiota bacterium]